MQRFLHCNDRIDDEREAGADPIPRAPAVAEIVAATSPSSSDGDKLGSTQLRTILSLIATLLLLSLVVNASVLVVMIKQARAER